MYLSKDSFLSALTITEEDFELPNGAGTVRIKPVSLEERTAIQQAHTAKDGKTDNLGIQTALLLTGLIEPRLTPADVPALKAGHPALVDAITMRVMAISGMAEDFEKKAGAGS